MQVQGAVERRMPTRRPGRCVREAGATPLVDEAPVNRDTKGTTGPDRRVEKELERRRSAEAIPRQCPLRPPKPSAPTPRRPRRSRGCAPESTRPKRDGRRGPSRGESARSAPAGRSPPTPAEFYEAVRAEEPSERQKAIVLMWVSEATTHEIMAAWAQHAYTFRQLAQARQGPGRQPGTRAAQLQSEVRGGMDRHRHPGAETCVPERFRRDPSTLGVQGGETGKPPRKSRALIN